jgi:hypothetical protein
MGRILGRCRGCRARGFISESVVPYHQCLITELRVSAQESRQSVSRPVIRVVCKDRQEGIPVGMYAIVSMLVRPINAPGMKCRMQKVKIENREVAYAKMNQIDQSSLGYPGVAEQKSNTWGKSARGQLRCQDLDVFPMCCISWRNTWYSKFGQMLCLPMCVSKVYRR